MLYTPELLALTVELADVPFEVNAPLQGHAVSRTCGSRIDLGCSYDPSNGVHTLGMRVSACAVGQASAAIFAQWFPGRHAEDVEQALVDVGAWLEGGATPDAIQRIEMLDPARAYRGRHEAILLPWRAGRDALCKAGRAG